MGQSWDKRRLRVLVGEETVKELKGRIYNRILEYLRFEGYLTQAIYFRLQRIQCQRFGFVYDGSSIVLVHGERARHSLEKGESDKCCRRLSRICCHGHHWDKEREVCHSSGSKGVLRRTGLEAVLIGVEGYAREYWWLWLCNNRRILAHCQI